LGLAADLRASDGLPKVGCATVLHNFAHPCSTRPASSTL
jgi:hypothetical protein